MAETFFDNPPVLQGNERTQLQQLYGYLNTVSQKLNEALMNITIEQMTAETQETIREGSRAEKAEAVKQYDSLKSLIIKTAEIVHTEMDEIRTTLTTTTEAVSEFGSLFDELENDITESAEGIRQEFTHSQFVVDSQTNTEYRIKTKQYIYCGLIGTDPNTGVGIYGIAIGDNVTNDDETLNTENRMATFTKDRLSFWQGDAEVAYFSNQIFHITQGEILNTLKIGNHMWKRLSDGGMALVAASGA